jgi:hypothetical protein
MNSVGIIVSRSKQIDCRSEEGDFLFYDANNRFHKESLLHVVTLLEPSSRLPKWMERFSKKLACASLQGRRRMIEGYMGIFAVPTTVESAY